MYTLCCLKRLADDCKCNDCYQTWCIHYATYHGWYKMVQVSNELSFFMTLSRIFDHVFAPTAMSLGFAASFKDCGADHFPAPLAQREPWIAALGPGGCCFWLTSFRCWTVPVSGSLFWYEAFWSNDTPHANLLVKLDEAVGYWLVDNQLDQLNWMRVRGVAYFDLLRLGFVSDLLRRVADQQSLDLWRVLRRDDTLFEVGLVDSGW